MNDYKNDNPIIEKVANDELIEAGLNQAVDTMHRISIKHGFWDSVDGEWNPAEKIALMHSELSEALEVLRKDPNAMSEKTPDCLALAEELADTLIRIFDFCGKMHLDIGKAVVAKSHYNESRPYKHGKKF